MAEMREIARQLKIQTGVCKRLAKDVSSYEKEAAEEKAQVDALADAAGAADDEAQCRLRQAREALAETQAMVEDSRRRLDEALPRLEAALAAAKDKLAAEVAADIAAAEAVLVDTRKVVASSCC